MKMDRLPANWKRTPHAEQSSEAWGCETLIGSGLAICLRGMIPNHCRERCRWPLQYRAQPRLPFPEAGFDLNPVDVIAPVRNDDFLYKNLWSCNLIST